MSHLVEFGLADGTSVLVQVAETSDGPAVAPAPVTHGPVTRGLPSGAEGVERAGKTFEEALSRVQPAVQAVINQLRSATEKPDEIQVEFGLDLHAEAGAFIASASTTANFSVALTWRRHDL